jgi:NADH-quinone oxidoreductase subunit N
VLGGTATATLLMGVSLLYGWSGSLALSIFGTALSSTDGLAAAGTALILAALFVKAAIVPLHAWAPDAYEGASVPVTAYMATVVKAAVLLAALRLFATAQVSGPMAAMLAALPLLSMAWGNLAAIRQTSFRRMIAYSSIAHAGYLFYAFLGAGEGRYEAIVFYLVAYGIMNLLAFVALPRGPDDTTHDRLDAFKGLYQRKPFAAVTIAIAMLSLAGLPPLPGFIAKFLIFRNVVAAGYTLYAVLGLVASYLGIYFYLRVIQYMFMSAEEPSASHGRPRRFALLAGVLCLVPAVLLAVFPGWFLNLL